MIVDEMVVVVGAEADVGDEGAVVAGAAGELAVAAGEAHEVHVAADEV